MELDISHPIISTSTSVAFRVLLFLVIMVGVGFLVMIFVMLRNISRNQHGLPNQTDGAQPSRVTTIVRD